MMKTCRMLMIATVVAAMCSIVGAQTKTQEAKAKKSKRPEVTTVEYRIPFRDQHQITIVLVDRKFPADNEFLQEISQGIRTLNKGIVKVERSIVPEQDNVIFLSAIPGLNPALAGTDEQGMKFWAECESIAVAVIRNRIDPKAFMVKQDSPKKGDGDK